MQTITELYKTVTVYKPSEKEAKKISDIYAICARIFEDCQIDKRNEPVYHMLIWNIQRFARLNRFDCRIKLIEILEDLEKNLLSTEKSIKKNEISGDKFLSYLGGLTQGICMATRERKKQKN